MGSYIKVIELSNLVWKSIKEDSDIKALYENKRVVVRTLCEKAVRQGCEKLSSDELISSHDGFLLYRRIQMCLSDKDIDEEINSKGRNVLRLIMEMDEKIANANSFVAKALLLDRRDEWLRMKSEVDESKKQLCDAIDEYIDDRTKDSMTWKKVKLTKGRTERANFAIHVIIDELTSNIGKRKISTYMNGRRVLAQIEEVNKLTAKMEKELCRLIDEGDIAAVGELMEIRFEMERSLDAAIDTYISKSSLLLGQEWMLIESENQNCTAALNRLFNCYRAGTISGEDCNVIRKPIDSALRKVRIYAVEQIKKQ